MYEYLFTNEKTKKLFLQTSNVYMFRTFVLNTFENRTHTSVYGINF